MISCWLYRFDINNLSLALKYYTLQSFGHCYNVTLYVSIRYAKNFAYSSRFSSIPLLLFLSFFPSPPRPTFHSCRWDLSVSSPTQKKSQICLMNTVSSRTYMLTIISCMPAAGLRKSMRLVIACRIVRLTSHDGVLHDAYSSTLTKPKLFGSGHGRLSRSCSPINGRSRSAPVQFSRPLLFETWAFISMPSWQCSSISTRRRPCATIRFVDVLAVKWQFGWCKRSSYPGLTTVTQC